MTYFPAFFGSPGSNQFWFGIVEDRADPLQLGRVRVRVYGFHTQDVTLIPTEALPWAQVLMPVTTAAMSGVGEAPVGLMIGSVVFGMWLDGQDQQTPFVLGTINTLEGDGSSGNILDRNGNVINDGNNNNIGVPGDFNPTGGGPQWLQIARGELGTKEIKGPQHNPRVLEYMKTVGHGSDDETPWCAGFVAWCLKQAGQSISGVDAWAKSFSRSSAFRRIDKLEYGAIVVFNRGSDPQSGHVGFCVGTEGGRVLVLGGNQSDSVSIAGKSASSIHAILWPVGGGDPSQFSGQQENVDSSQIVQDPTMT